MIIILNRRCLKCGRTFYNTRFPLHLRSITKSPDPTSVQPPNPKKIYTDMIGPADPVSNLRKIVFKQPVNETALEKHYRKKRQEVQEWNHSFWTDHNSRFYKEREEYIKKNLPEGQQNLTADEMSVFYKAFLDKNWISHVKYNVEWYKRNIHLLGLALRVKIRKLFKIK